MIRIVIVDDQPLVREGLHALLSRAGDMTVVGTASSADAAVTTARREHPEVVLMDIRMPGGDGLDATRRIVADPELRRVQVIVLTTFDTDDNILSAVRAGAAGFLLKDTGADELREAVRIVARGDALLSPAVTRRVMRAAATSATLPSATRLTVLTEREQQVLSQVGAGLSNTEIGQRLSISPETVRTHVGRLLGKLEARDRAQLVALAYETGLITAGDPGTQ